MSPKTRIHGGARAAPPALPSRLLWPFPHDVDVAPQLVAVSLAQAVIAATRLAVESAHPVLAIPPRDNWAPDLSRAEHLAALVLHVSDQLAEFLDDYAAAVVRQHDDDPDSSPF